MKRKTKSKSKSKGQRGLEVWFNRRKFIGADGIRFDYGTHKIECEGVGGKVIFNWQIGDVGPLRLNIPYRTGSVRCYFKGAKLIGTSCSHERAELVFYAPREPTQTVNDWR